NCQVKQTFEKTDLNHFLPPAFSVRHRLAQRRPRPWPWPASISKELETTCHSRCKLHLCSRRRFGPVSDNSLFLGSSDFGAPFGYEICLTGAHHHPWYRRVQ